MKCNAACLGRAIFAQMGPYTLTDGQYLKVVCTRTAIGKIAG